MLPSKSLEEVLQVSLKNRTVSNRWADKEDHAIENYSRFINLISRMLEMDPEKRIKPMEALQHPFFTQEPNWCDETTYKYLESGSLATRKRKKSFLVARSPKKIRKHQA